MKAGAWVEVRSKEEILGTLDGSGQLDGMPFMPEMFAYCGKRFRVFKRAHKTCDTVFPTRGRRVDRAVHLDTRCDGSGHGGCEANCLIFWKEAWLKPVDGPGTPAGVAVRQPVGSNSNRRCSEVDVTAATRVLDETGAPKSYMCQATRLPYFTRDLAWWEPRQYVEDYLSGNVGLWRMMCGFVYSTYYSISQLGIGLGRPMRWLYNRLHRLWGGPTFPRSTGTIPDGSPTPTARLDVQPGELVRVKTHEEILRTLTKSSKNRGMLWDAELVPYCGSTFRVLKRVSRIIDERTGEMVDMKNPCIMLDSVVCQAKYSTHRMFCPRSIYPYWREVWLERVENPVGQVAERTGDGAKS